MDRVEVNTKYYYISDTLQIEQSYDTRSIIDTKRFECGNYFPVRSLALSRWHKVKESYK